MITKEVNITELSKMLGEEYEKYEDRIFELETALIEIRMFVNSIQKHKAADDFINFECNQILEIINNKIGENNGSKKSN